MTEIKRLSLVKPTVHTCFHIDFNWWKNSDRDWRVYLFNYLCKEHQNIFSDQGGGGLVDWVDPGTAEVRRVDGLQHALISHCAKQDDFITQHTALVDAVFRSFLANDNQPLNAEQLSLILGKPAQTILKTLSVNVLQGIRPCMG